MPGGFEPSPAATKCAVSQALYVWGKDDQSAAGPEQPPALSQETDRGVDMLNGVAQGDRVKRLTFQVGLFQRRFDHRHIAGVARRNDGLRVVFDSEHPPPQPPDRKRRVGKECRSRWSPHHYKKNK